MKRFDYLHTALVAATVFGWAYAAAWAYFRGFCVESGCSAMTALICTIYCIAWERERGVA